MAGWALDDQEVVKVQIYREPVGSEPAGTLILVGNAVLVEGARPDVALAHPTLPLNTRAGWGYLLSTNLLPNQGNGSYTLHILAEDREGQGTWLGSRTFTADNKHAALPFGAIDSPEQVKTIGMNGNLYFTGWALTPLPKSIPVDGSTMTLFIDGAPRSTLAYDRYRADIADQFPGLANSLGAGAVWAVLPATVGLGLHTVGLSITDAQGVTAASGSRFFMLDTIETSSGVGARPGAPADGSWEHPVDLLASNSDSAARPLQPKAIGTPAEPGPGVLVRRGWLDTALTRVPPDAQGVHPVLGEELDRLEVRFGSGEGSYDGYLLVDGTRQPLPIGSTLDPATGVFTWQPGVGFIGTYDLVFQLSSGATEEQIRVRVVLIPKGGDQTLRMWIDAPAQATVAQPFAVSGWAVDRAASLGAGVAVVQVWAYPTPDSGTSPIFVGSASYGQSRADVGAAFGPQFANAGYTLSVAGLPAGVYDLVVQAHSMVTGALDALVVRVTVN